MNTQLIKRIYLLTTIIVSVSFCACKKEGKVTGGSITDAHVNLTTYDYLKTNAIFDTLVLLIDKAGLRDTVNSAITFFAPTDYSIRELLRKRSDTLKVHYNDESLLYTIDSFNVSELRDSLRAYMFKSSITRDILTLNDNLYSNLAGEPFNVRLSETTDYTSDFINTRPKYMFLAKVINGLDPVDNSDVPEEDRDKRELLQTTGILTTTGVLHVLNNYHTFYWD